jgi:hypothetical protein
MSWVGKPDVRRALFGGKGSVGRAARSDRLRRARRRSSGTTSKQAKLRYVIVKARAR